MMTVHYWAGSYPAARRLGAAIALSAPLLAACGGGGGDQPPTVDRARSGGDTTVFLTRSDAFSLPAANLTVGKRADFQAGNSFFREPWIIAPASSAARDGLGPLFNVNACQACHIRDGRGHAPQSPSDSADSMTVKLAVPPQTGGDEAALQAGEIAAVPEPNYGPQFHDRGIQGVAPEGRVTVSYTERPVRLADGSTVQLREPTLQLSELNYGELHSEVRMSARIAPPMIGQGLLEALQSRDILAGEDPNDANGDGISGRANRVFDTATGQAGVVGRFGWKASEPNVRQQAANAFVNDIGITSSLRPNEACTAAQSDCLMQPTGGEPELSAEILDLVTFYSQHLAVPGRRNVNSASVQRGEQQFLQAGCADCHRPQWQTGQLAGRPELSNQTIFPYTDILLHDMGEGLADELSEYQAAGREWRTPPLWGIGLAAVVAGDQPVGYLHDGRARTLLEAVLWHGGEAAASAAAVRAMSGAERDDLIDFLESL